MLTTTDIPEKLLTGDVAVAEFCDVWNLYLELKVPKLVLNPKTREMEMVAILGDDGKPKHNPPRPQLEAFEVTRAHAAALFLRYGYDSDGLMPYAVFANALTTGPARLLGMRDLIDLRSRGRNGFDRGDNVKFDGQIIYPKQRGSVFAPSAFDHKAAARSSKAPSAGLHLEHVYGYAGDQGLANNLHFLVDPDEIVYYVAAIGIVYHRVDHVQRFFFGHNNDIRSLALHPSNHIVATGQNKAVGGDDDVAYVCVWDSRSMCELQRLHMPIGSRAVIALGFSPDGNTLVTVTSDNQHSLYVWDWMTDLAKRKIMLGAFELRDLPWETKASKASAAPRPGRKYYRIQERYAENKAEPGMAAPTWPTYISGTEYGPSKRMRDLEASPSGFFYAGEKTPRLDAKNNKVRRAEDWLLQ